MFISLTIQGLDIDPLTQLIITIDIYEPFIFKPVYLLQTSSECELNVFK